MSRKPELLTFLTEWYDRRMEEGIVEKNVNTTSPMLTLTYLYEITKKESYLSFIGEWADWIMEEKGLIRTGDGCFQHMITGNPNDSEDVYKRQIWEWIRFATTRRKGSWSRFAARMDTGILTVRVSGE